VAMFYTEKQTGQGELPLTGIHQPDTMFPAT
jgi:hypothetical protein